VEKGWFSYEVEVNGEYEFGGFGWMKVVFDRWIMFGMMFGSDWVKKFWFLGRYESLKVFGYGGFKDNLSGERNCGD